MHGPRYPTSRGRNAFEATTHTHPAAGPGTAGRRSFGGRHRVRGRHWSRRERCWARRRRDQVAWHPPERPGHAEARPAERQGDKGAPWQVHRADPEGPSQEPGLVWGGIARPTHSWPSCHRAQLRKAAARRSQQLLPDRRDRRHRRRSWHGHFLPLRPAAPPGATVPRSVEPQTRRSMIVALASPPPSHMVCSP